MLNAAVRPLGNFRRALCPTALMVGMLIAFPPALRADIKPDSGKFLLTIQETDIGMDTFTADAEGGSEADIAISLGGQTNKSHISVKAKAGQLTEIATDAGPAGKFTLTLDGEKGHLKAEGRTLLTADVTLPAHLLPFSNFGPHLLSRLLAAYDLSKGGPQTFDLVLTDAVGPKGVIPLKGTLLSNGAKPMQVAGKKIPVSRYLLTLMGINIELMADSDGRILMWNVPAQRYVAVRDGYQDLTKPETPADPRLSKPTYNVKKETGVKIAMRDGVKLAADIYRPDAPGKFPVILQRTPYGRTKALEAGFYARRGYVFVAQDVRGKFDSEGKWEPFVNEAKDGYDTVEWCAAQPWSNGDVGMIGGSYLGFVQWAAAREGSNHLKCLIPIVSPPDPFFNVPYAFGAFFLYPAAWWAGIVDGQGMNPLPKFESLEPFRTLPLTEVDKKLFGHHIAFFQEWLKHSTNDAYWDQVNFNARMKSFAPLPALHVSGWFDGDGIGTKRNYAAMVAAGQKHQKLIYGPWSHAVNAATKIAELDFGPQSVRDLDTLYLRWFDRWLKGIPNGVDKEPPVDAFLMGTNAWRKFSAWPPREARLTKWYFHSGGRANSSAGDGRLSLEKPSAAEPADRYTYDPAHPFTSPGIEEALKAGGVETPSLDISKGERDPNVLVYTSDVLTEDIAVAGPISLHLVASTSAKDTDWVALLTDVYPDGKSIELVQGILRARFRKSFQKPTLLKPGEVADYTLDLWALGNVFKKGHRLRVIVTSSLFPIYDRNLNTGEDLATGTQMVTAQQTVYHDDARASYLMLPTLPR
ncbi:MAG TPA: CocE/NonD family hydrolase [Chthonomonadaceae bacterium]|nr:CocE/NonD family hydrolase [Chthonomonadaceae bacterium]